MNETTRKPDISLFTPCYNCESTIRDVAKCVSNQTFKNFEWIIYNDGSTDKSEEIIEDILKQYSNLNIVFLNPGINRGKHIAWNRAIDIAKGELFICADADDTFEPDSLEFYYNKWNEVKEDPSCCGILGLVDTMETHELHAGKWPEDGWKSNYLEFALKYKICGETWGATRTDLLRRRYFLELYNGYFAEHWVWHWLALEGYSYRCYNHVTRHYRTLSEGSLMDTQKKRKQKPQQLIIYLIVILWELKYTSKWYWKYKKRELFIKPLLLINYIRLYIFNSAKTGQI